MTQKEPLSWTPKLLAFKEARDLHDHEMIQHDLWFAKSCFALISDRDHGVIFPMSVDNSRSHTIDWCVFVAGIICYRRCFTSGARLRLHRTDLLESISEDFLDLHDTMIAIADKNVAHSVNEMELGCTTIQVAVDSKGQLHRGGLGRQGLGIGPLGPPAYKAMAELVDHICQGVLKGKIEALKQAVEQTVSQMPDGEVLALPEGFPPHINRPRYGQPRRWPKNQE